MAKEGLGMSELQYDFDFILHRSSKGKREALRRLLSDFAWHHMAELQKAAGYRYGARLHELKKEGVRYEVERRGENLFFYRMMR